MQVLGWVFPIALPALVVGFCLVVQGRKKIARAVANLFRRAPVADE